MAQVRERERVRVIGTLGDMAAISQHHDRASIINTIRLPLLLRISADKHD